jgi:hypothetical protein
MGVRLGRIVVAVALVVGGMVALPRADAAVVADPLVSVPPNGLRGHALFDSWFELAPLGYTDAEFFISGTARSSTGATAPYTTRIIVTRPTSAARFNGTVLLDWVNVTAQFENAVDTVETHEMLLREGYAFVHVSAQKVGICCTPLTPKVWDPVRYAKLKHPGDAYANDIFSQVAKAIRAPRRGVNAMGGLTVSKVLAAGQSQSASRLYDYVTTTQANAGVIDGFLIHGGGSKEYDTPPAAPVLHLLSDAEASPTAPSTATNYRLWEIAATAHSDFWIGYHEVFGSGPRVLASAPRRPASAEDAIDAIAGNYGEQLHPMEATCVLAGSTMPMHYAASTAIHQLNRWVRTGSAPRSGPRFRFIGPTLAKDRHGNTLGGIRLPPADVPVAQYVTTACGLGGFTIPFTDLQLRNLYGTHATYYARMKAASDGAVRAGWLLPPDAVDMMRRACKAKNRFGQAAGPCGLYSPPAFDSLP